VVGRYDGDTQVVTKLWQTEIQKGEGDGNMGYVHLFIHQGFFYQPFRSWGGDQVMVPEIEGSQSYVPGLLFYLLVPGPMVEEDYLCTTGF
jgi:hypothetical protein